MTTKTRTYWESDNGAIYCQEHLGTYMTEAIASKPRASVHHTPIGTYWRLTAQDAAEFCAAIGASDACETCRPRTEWRPI